MSKKEDKNISEKCILQHKTDKYLGNTDYYIERFNNMELVEDINKAIIFNSVEEAKEYGDGIGSQDAYKIIVVDVIVKEKRWNSIQPFELQEPKTKEV